MERTECCGKLSGRQIRRKSQQYFTALSPGLAGIGRTSEQNIQKENKIATKKTKSQPGCKTVRRQKSSEQPVHQQYEVISPGLVWNGRTSEQGKQLVRQNGESNTPLKRKSILNVNEIDANGNVDRSALSTTGSEQNTKKCRNSDDLMAEIKSTEILSATKSGYPYGILVKKKNKKTHSFKQPKKTGKKKKKYSTIDVLFHKSGNPWKSIRLLKNQGLIADNEELENELPKSVLGILNKITFNNFEKLIDDMKLLPIDTESKLQSLVNYMFLKAVSEPEFCPLYSAVCDKLQHCYEKSIKNSSKTFQSILIHNCQLLHDKFINNVSTINKGKEINVYADHVKKTELQMKLERKNQIFLTRSFGNYRFIGELFKLGWVTPKIVSDYLDKLLSINDERGLEAVCILFITCGNMIETHLGSVAYSYVKRMKDMLAKPHISPRIRFKLLDAIDFKKYRLGNFGDLGFYNFESLWNVSESYSFLKNDIHNPDVNNLSEQQADKSNADKELISAGNEQNNSTVDDNRNMERIECCGKLSGQQLRCKSQQYFMEVSPGLVWNGRTSEQNIQKEYKISTKKTKSQPGCKTVRRKKSSEQNMERIECYGELSAQQIRRKSQRYFSENVQNEINIPSVVQEEWRKLKRQQNQSRKIIRQQQRRLRKKSLENKENAKTVAIAIAHTIQTCELWNGRKSDQMSPITTEVITSSVSEAEPELILIDDDTDSSDSEDIQCVAENKVPEEDVSMALKLKLPPKFFAYRHNNNYPEDDVIDVA